MWLLPLPSISRYLLVQTNIILCEQRSIFCLVDFSKICWVNRSNWCHFLFWQTINTNDVDIVVISDRILFLVYSLVLIVQLKTNIIQLRKRMPFSLFIYLPISLLFCYQKKERINKPMCKSFTVSKQILFYFATVEFLSFAWSQ